MFTFSGTVSFLLFFLGDLNDAFWHRRSLKPAFLIGTLLLTVSTAGLLLQQFPKELKLPNFLWLAMALLFGVLLIWSLFFSFPASQAYVESSRQRAACTDGMYALCRHPGVLWFWLMYGCLIPAVGFPAEVSLLYGLMNTLLAWAEDKWIFPILFFNYQDYKTRTPFLIPTAGSFRAWIHFIGPKP